MKAKEYFEKYKDIPANNQSLTYLVKDLLTEALDLIKARKCKGPEAIVACYKEINNKYNSICNMFEKEYGFPVLIKDGFKEVVKEHYKKELPYFVGIIERFWK